MLKNKNWFTLIEIIIWILIFSMVIIWWFQALSAVTLWKVKLIEKTDITKDAFYFSEKFFDEVKKGWTIDFEEYFNREVTWNTTFSSWHYALDTWFWNFWNWWSTPWTSWANNFWNWFYYCRSTTTAMWTGWCYSDGTFNDLGISWWPQRYWQYVFQFIDYNSNKNNDWSLFWDENWDLNIRWDDDDENLWEWPTVFTWWTDTKEIYLISWDRKKRTIFRWSWYKDPDPKNTNNCDSTTFWTWCLWTVEFLRLEAKDWGFSHSSWSTSTWSFDWIIDTWIIDKELTWWAEVVVWSNDTNYRQPLFPNSVNVTNFEVYPYPNIDKRYSWKSSSIGEINPYIKIKLSLSPSWKKRWAMKWIIPEIKILTTINLTDYFSK